MYENYCYKNIYMYVFVGDDFTIVKNMTHECSTFVMDHKRSCFSKRPKRVGLRFNERKNSRDKNLMLPQCFSVS